MPHHKAAKKSLRKDARRKKYNKGYKIRMKKLEKETKRALENKDIESLKEKKKKVDSLFSKASSKGVIHKNKARRKISKITKKINVALKT